MEFESQNIAMVNNSAEKYEIVPEIVLSYFKKNYQIMENTLKIKKILGRKSILGDVIDIINSLESHDLDETIFDETVESAKNKADLKLKEAIEKIDLKGDEVLRPIK